MTDTTPKAALLDDSTIFTRTINADAMKQLQAEIEVWIRTEAEQKAAEVKNGSLDAEM